MTGAAPTTTGAAPARGDGLGEFRPNASWPLPPLRPVADFVGLPTGSRTLPAESRFAIAQVGALGWLLVSVALSLAVGGGLTATVSWPYALVLVVLVVGLPGYLAAFRGLALLLDDRPELDRVRPATPITAIVAARDGIAAVSTLAYLAAQDYDGPLRVIVVEDGGPLDAVGDAVRRAAPELRIAADVIRADPAGGVDPRNAALAAVTTPLVLSVASGACLHPSAVRLLVARLASCGPRTAAAAGHALTRSRRDGPGGEALAVGYAREVDAVQRTQGLFGGALVADGSCTAFRTEALRAVNGWPPVEASDVVVTWRFLERGWRAVHEPLAIAFTTEIVTLGSSGCRRARGARGLRAAGQESGSGAYRLAQRTSRVLARVDRATPVLDVAFTIAWIQALLLIFLGSFTLVGAYLVLVAPISLAAVALERRYHREVLDEAGLVLAPTRAGRLAPLVALDAVQAPAAVWERARDTHPALPPIKLNRRRLEWRARPYA